MLLMLLLLLRMGRFVALKDFLRSQMSSESFMTVGKSGTYRFRQWQRFVYANSAAYSADVATKLVIGTAAATFAAKSLFLGDVMSVYAVVKVRRVAFKYRTRYISYLHPAL